MPLQVHLAPRALLGPRDHLDHPDVMANRENLAPRGLLEMPERKAPMVYQGHMGLLDQEDPLDNQARVIIVHHPVLVLGIIDVVKSTF